MPTCLECGFNAPRLQWTHFKYKCTGRFNNGTEYKKVYPNADLVDADLSKRTAVTKQNLIEKYGIKEGEERWESYCKKQSRSNTYEYKKEKYGWSKEQFDEFNRSRAVTLKLMIDRHGEERGALLWQEYCARQAYTNTLDYFVIKYGKKEGIEKYNKVNLLKAHTLENIQRVHNCSVDGAKKLLEQRNVSQLYTSELERVIINEIEQAMGIELEYTIKSKQYCVYGNNKANFYDVVHNNRAIEINGDYWHCNPKKYDSNFYHPHAQVLAEEIWSRDQKKLKLIEKERSIPVLVIWESEYIANQQETIKKCLNWIQKGKK